MLWLYRQGFSGTYNYNRASATSIILGAIGICLSLVMFYVLRDRDEARLKKIIRRERRESKQRY
jgi:multiple sugar transport system permease protein